MSDHYGEEWRPWPNQQCGHQPPCGRGYYSNYRDLFARMFAHVGRYFLLCKEREDGSWGWTVGSFSWTPDGELWEARKYGMNATRRFAESEARTCAESMIRTDAEWRREYDERERERLAAR